MIFLDSPSILAFFGIVLVAFVAWRALRQHAAPRASPETEVTPTPAPSSADPGAVPPCMACGRPSYYQLPALVERRGLLDAAALDGVWRRLGVRREVQLVLVLERPISVPTNLCPGCHRIARSLCEDYLAKLAQRRTMAAVEEARDVSSFHAFGLADALREATDEQVKRARQRSRNGVNAPSA